MARPYRSPPALAPSMSADLRACGRCGGLIDARMRICPACGRWLGPGSFALWLSLVVIGSLLIVLAFYLPWLNGGIGGISHLLSGYDLAQIAQRLSASSASARPTAAASIALYLAPAAGVSMLVLLILAPALRLQWSLIGRLIVGLAAMPLQLALLVALFAVGVLGQGGTPSWPHIGLFATGLGSILATVGGIALGGPDRTLAAGQPGGRPPTAVL